MKHVRTWCHGPIAVAPLYRQPWADVWLRFRGRPGRKVYTYGPTLISKPELHGALRFQRDLDPPDLKEIAKLERAAARIETRDLLIVPDPGRCPDIYTAADYIDRREAERMLQFLMTSLGFGRTRFVWARPRLIIDPWPTT